MEGNSIETVEKHSTRKEDADFPDKVKALFGLLEGDKDEKEKRTSRNH